MTELDAARTVLVYLFRSNAESLEVLLLKRVDRPGLNGFWQGVSGRCEIGEAYAQAAVREVLEEIRLGVQVHDADYGYNFASTEHQGIEINEQVFYAFTEGDPTLSREHSEFLWCSLDKAMELLLWEDNKKALQRTYELATARYN
jgi:dATP pyrophosphohydrolase